MTVKLAIATFMLWTGLFWFLWYEPQKLRAIAPYNVKQKRILHKFWKFRVKCRIVYFTKIRNPVLGDRQLLSVSLRFRRAKLEFRLRPAAIAMACVVPSFLFRSSLAVAGIIGPGIQSLRLPSIIEYGAVGNASFENDTAMEKAINALAKEGAGGINGGRLYCPPGIYVHKKAMPLKEANGVWLFGGSGNQGGAALGVGFSNPSTIFLYTGEEARAWDWRKAIGNTMESIACIAKSEGFTGFIWDFSGTGGAPTALNEIRSCTAEAARAPGGTKEILKCSGTNLAFANGHHFDHTTFASVLFGVSGRATVNTEESVAHHFNDCWWTGNQTANVLNPDCAWSFKACVAEGLFNAKGEGPTGVAFILCQATFLGRGCLVETCWISSNVAAKRVGTAIEWRGRGLKVTGGTELATCESGTFFPEGPKGCSVENVSFTKLTHGNVIAGKTVRSHIEGNTYTEVAEPLLDTAKEYDAFSVIEGAEGSLAGQMLTQKGIGVFAHAAPAAQPATIKPEEITVKVAMERVDKILKEYGIST